MRVKYIGDYYKVSLIKGKEYEVVAREPKHGLLAIVDETGEEYCFFPQFFEVVDDSPTIEEAQGKKIL